MNKIGVRPKFKKLSKIAIQPGISKEKTMFDQLFILNDGKQNYLFCKLLKWLKHMDKHPNDPTY